MRAFIGIDFGDEINQEIFDVQNKLKANSESGRWKPIDNFHLTLKFLGEVSPTQVEQINQAMSSICNSEKPLNLAVSGLWTFDGKDSIRVLWLGLTGDLDALRDLQNNIDGALQPLGFQAEKRGFAPHVTIGQDIVFKTDFAKIQAELGDVRLSTMTIKSLQLFESVLDQNKRIYKKVAEYSLSAN